MISTSFDILSVLGREASKSIPMYEFICIAEQKIEALNSKTKIPNKVAPIK